MGSETAINRKRFIKTDINCSTEMMNIVGETSNSPINSSVQLNGPKYTPVRRNHGTIVQRSKPQSPKILLPQCFLD